MKPHGTYDIAFQAGAASRDAEIESLRQQLAAANNLITTYRNDTTNLRQQLADSQKQVTLLRDALENAKDALWNYGVKVQTEEALAATADLSGVILCHAEPSLYFYPPTGKTLHASRIEKSRKETWKPLYRAWEPKK